MATLKELCSNIPSELSRQAVQYELLHRQTLSYQKRQGALRAEENVFSKCKQCRPEKGKYKNRYSREEAGTIGDVTMGIRTGQYSVSVCKVKKYW